MVKVQSNKGLAKRIVPCLDVKNGETVKGTNFVNLRSAGDPVELGKAYSDAGADELVFLDITASFEERKTFTDMVTRVAAEINIPFTVGGGINELKDVERLLNAGADKVSINSAEVPTKMGTFPQYQYPKTLARYAEIGRSVGLTGKNDAEVFEKLLAKLDELMRTIEILPTIRDYGVDEKHFLETLDEMSEQAFNDQCTGANPRYPLVSELKDIYLKAYYGEMPNKEKKKAK